MLKLLSTEPEWLELLPGVRVQFAPIGPKAFRAAQQECVRALAADAEDTEEATDALSRVLIRRGVLAWEGIGEAEGDKPADPADPAALARFVAHPLLFLAAQERYVMPFLLRDAEGKGSPASPGGTGTGEMPAGGHATGAVRGKRKAGARAART